MGLNLVNKNFAREFGSGNQMIALDADGNFSIGRPAITNKKVVTPPSTSNYVACDPKGIVDISDTLTPIYNNKGGNVYECAYNTYIGGGTKFVCENKTAELRGIYGGKLCDARKIVGGQYDGKYINARYTKLASSIPDKGYTGKGTDTPPVAVIKEETVPLAAAPTVTETPAVEETDVPVDHLNLSTNRVKEGNYLEDTDYYKDITKFYNTYGSPFIYLDSTDPCYYKTEDIPLLGTPKIGRSQLSSIYASPTVLSICPGKASYLPSLYQSEKNYVLEDILNRLKEVNNGADIGGVTLGDENTITASGVLAQQLYEFECDYGDYINRLNVLARTTSIMLGIGDKISPTGEKYKTANYAYFTTSKRGSGGSGTSTNPVDEVLWQMETQLTSSFNDDQYIHFFLSGDGTQSTEDHNISTTPSPMANLLGEGGGLHEISKSLNFLFGGAMSTDGMLGGAKADFDKLLADVGGNSDNIIGSLTSIIHGYFQGGRMIVPDMIDNVDYAHSLSCTMNFRSLTGDPEDVFLHTFLPTLAILNFALPKQLTNNMYGYPYIVKIYQKGYYNSDLAVISNLMIRRGGQDDTSWTMGGLATDIEVQFSIVPLHSSLMGGNGRNPLMFMDNSGLLEYLGNLCGIDLNVNNLQLKTKLYENLFKNWVSDVPAVIGMNSFNKLKQKAEKIFKFN